MYEQLSTHPLDDKFRIYSGRVPGQLEFDAARFDVLWKMHPGFHHEVPTPRGYRPIPRWQAAYGADYAFSGTVVKAEETPQLLQPFLDWAQNAFDPRMNGLFLNWYEGSEHYIGQHNDEDRDLHVGSPIITISYGEARKFRLRPNKGKGFVDLFADPGQFFVIPWETNRAWKHECPKSKRYLGRRISVTVRAFVRGIVVPRNQSTKSSPAPDRISRGPGPTVVNQNATIGVTELSVGSLQKEDSPPTLEPALATLGFGFLERSVLEGKSRYPCLSEPLRQEIESCLIPPADRRQRWRDPRPNKIDALSQTLIDAVRVYGGTSKGVCLLHVMRRLTTSFYNYDEFLGDCDNTFRHGNLGERLGNHDLAYKYVALPSVAPPARLLDQLEDHEYGWEAFKQDYRNFLVDDALAEVVDAVRGALSRDLLPVLLCCEPFVNCFETLSPAEKKNYGCHRFLLAADIVRELAICGISIGQTHLDPSRVRRTMVYP